jgi:hypothetical protein
MSTIVTILTVVLVVFLYLHVTYQLKTSDDLEVYDLGETLPDKAKLEEVGNLRQPFVFQMQNPELLRVSPRKFDCAGFDLTVVDASNVAVPLAVAQARPLFEKSPLHYTENNADFLKETLLSDVLSRNDFHLRPPMTIQKQYDLVFGGDEARTKLKYSDHCRNYLYGVDGTDVQVKLCPPRYAKYLSVTKDYERQEFYSTFDPWRETDAYSKVKFVDVTLRPGTMLSVPAYWFYSIRPGKNGSVAIFRYKTFMNSVATLPDLVLGILQRQNVKHVVATTLNA